jgi:hypothetical protein
MGMEAETDREVEYDRLREGLVWLEIEGFARSVHVTQSYIDGSPKMTHLRHVSDEAGKLAEQFYIGCDDLFEQKYVCIVCRAAGLLHEVMLAGKDFEDVVEASDEAVANVVSEITPDVRLPRPKRVHHFLNRVGLASVPGQLIVLADLQQHLAGLQHLLQMRTPPVELVKEQAGECRAVALSLNKVERMPITAKHVQNLLVSFKQLEKRCRRGNHGS